MSVELPPGQRYLIRQLPYLVAPPAVVYVVAQDVFGNQLPLSLLLLAYVFSWPIAFALSIQWTDVTNKIRARRRGAVIPPTIEHKYPGGLDVIQGSFRSDRSKYLGASCFYCDPTYAHR